MELIYMYLGNIKRPLQNQGIHFGDKFLVNYNPERRELTIAKRSDTKPCIYGDRIESIDSGYEGITRYLYDSVHNHEFASKMASKPGTEITIMIYQEDKADFARFVSRNADKNSDLSSSGQKIVSRLLYRDRMSLLDSGSIQFPWALSKKEEEPFTHRERMVLIYLEELVCYSIKQRDTWVRPYQGKNTYTQRKAYLLSMLEDFDRTNHFLAKEIVAGIEAIPEHYFVNGAKAVIPLHDMREGNFLMRLTQGLDKSLLAEHEINHRYFIRLSFAGISTGEAQYLDLYAALYHAIKTYRHRKGDTCVLLLDEPDCRFHPEWSRNFVLNLTELLNTDVFRDYRYQVIISTHSPMLVSDVPKESIHCLHRDEGGKISIRSSDYGLMSNLNDLITDSFFADSIFGAYAERYVNTLIEDINATEQPSGFVPRDRLEELRGRLNRIEDQVIRESLDRRLRRLEARSR